MYISEYIDGHQKDLLVQSLPNKPLVQYNNIPYNNIPLIIIRKNQEKDSNDPQAAETLNHAIMYRELSTQLKTLDEIESCKDLTYFKDKYRNMKNGNLFYWNEKHEELMLRDF